MNLDRFIEIAKVIITNPVVIGTAIGAILLMKFAGYIYTYSKKAPKPKSKKKSAAPAPAPAAEASADSGDGGEDSGE